MKQLCLGHKISPKHLLPNLSLQWNATTTSKHLLSLRCGSVRVNNRPEGYCRHVIEKTFLKKELLHKIVVNKNEFKNETSGIKYTLTETSQFYLFSKKGSRTLFQKQIGCCVLIIDCSPHFRV